MRTFLGKKSRVEQMHLESREGQLAEADWYYADLDATPSTGLLSRLRRADRLDPRIQGPVTMAQLQQLASSGRVDRQRTMIWRPHWNAWQQAGEVQVLFAHQTPPPLPTRTVKRGWIFRALESIVFFALSLVCSIPLAILSGIVRTFQFVSQWLNQLSGQGSSDGNASRGPLWWSGWAAMGSQVMACLLGVAMIAAEFEEELIPVYCVFWVINVAVWAWFVYRAWEEIPAKYQPTDRQTMLYWLLVPGLSTFGWLRLLPELGQATHRLRYGADMPPLPYRISWWSTVLCFVPIFNILGGMMLLVWLHNVSRDLRHLSQSSTSPAWHGN